MNPLSLIGAVSGGVAAMPSGVDLAKAVVTSMEPPGNVVASQPVQTPATTGAGKNLAVPTGPGTKSRMAGPGGDIWGAILSALQPGPTGARLDYGILDPKKRDDYMTGLAEKTLAKGPKGG